MDLVGGSQDAKTTTVINIALARMDDNPVATIIVAPTQDDCLLKIEPEISDAIKDCPSLHKKLAKGQGDKKTEKLIGGIPLWLAWGGSSRGLSGKSAGLVIITDRDQIKDIPGQGSIDGLADGRGHTFPGFKALRDSTPTLGDVETFVHPETGHEHWAVSDNVISPIWSNWQQGSREELAVPCPHCGDYFIPRSKLLWWPGKGTPDECSPDEALKEARLTCQKCGALIEDKHRKPMMARCEYIGPGQDIVDGKKIGELISVRHRSLWRSGIMSTLRANSFGKCAAMEISARNTKKSSNLQTLANTVFGECYSYKADAPEWQIVKKHIADYEALEIPRGVQRLFLTVDVQKDRLPYVIRGWGYGFETWLIEWGEIWGDTDQPFVWEKLKQLREKRFGDMFINAAAVDAGYRKDEVYDWCAANDAYATKGNTRASRPYFAKSLEVKKNGKTYRHGQQLWTVDTGMMKGWVYGRLGWEESGWNVPKDVSDTYCKQVCSEAQIKTPTGTDWKPVYKENHMLDCEGLQVFLSKIERISELQPLDDDDNPNDDQPMFKPLVLKAGV